MTFSSQLNNQALLEFVYGGGLYGELQDCLVDFGLDGERAGELFQLVDVVVHDEMPLAELPTILGEAFGLDEKKAKDFACAMTAVAFLPLETFVPGISEQIRAWGGRPEDFAVEKIGVKKIPLEELTREIVMKSHLEMSEFLEKRLGFLVQGYVNKERDLESLRTFFGRGLNIGGLGLVKEQIDTLLQVVQEACVGVALGEKEPEHNVEPESSVDVSLDVVDANQEKEEERAVLVPVRTEILTAPPQSIRSSRDLHADDIPAPAVQKAREVQRDHGAAIATAFAGALDVVLQHAAPTLQTLGYSAEHFTDIATKSLRGVRDAYQTRDYLEQDAGIRGVALTQLLDALKEGEHVYKVALEALMQTPEEDLDLRDDDVARIEAAEVKKAEVYLSQGSMPPQAPGTGKRIVMTDIVTPKAPPRGPVEQLRSLSIHDFRRLSGDAAVAAQKLYDIMEGLLKMSESDRVQAVRAWRMSPLIHLYLEISSEALRHERTLAEECAARRTAGVETLTPSELTALQGLNERLRF